MTKFDSFLEIFKAEETRPYIENLRYVFGDEMSKLTPQEMVYSLCAYVCAIELSQGDVKAQADLHFSLSKFAIACSYALDYLGGVHRSARHLMAMREQALECDKTVPTVIN